MPQSATPSFRFPVPAPLPLEAHFDGGRLTSDGGLPWLEQADRALALCAAFAVCIPDWRRGPVRHALATLVRQRVFQIACGYEDQDDADVAAHLGAHESTVRIWIRAGELKASRFGTRIGYRIRRGDYEDFLRRRSVIGAITRQLLDWPTPTHSVPRNRFGLRGNTRHQGNTDG